MYKVMPTPTSEPTIAPAIVTAFDFLEALAEPVSETDGVTIACLSMPY